MQAAGTESCGDCVSKKTTVVADGLCVANGCLQETGGHTGERVVWGRRGLRGRDGAEGSVAFAWESDGCLDGRRAREA